MPEQGPDIKLIENPGRYAPGDVLRANCTSSNSKPAAYLRFLIDGEQVKKSLLNLNCATMILNRNRCLVFKV